jgi:hypothetical protein
VNLVDAEAATALEGFLNSESSEAIADGITKVTNLFLEHYVEQYDFIFLVTDRELDTMAAGRFSTVTQKAKPGTGGDYDFESEGYKTNGRLLGLIGIEYNDYFGPFGHEMFHNWGVFLDASFGFGVGLEENAGPHWGYTGSRGVLGGFDATTLRCEAPPNASPPDCTAEANGRFRYRVESFGLWGNSARDDVFAPLELYLMGLVPLSEVPSPIPVLLEASQVDDSFDSTTNTVAIEAAGINSVETAALVERHGLVRELTEDERAFTAAFVVVSAMPASDAALDHVGEWAAIFGNRLTSEEHSFEELTSGRATLDTRLGPRRSVDEPPPALRDPFNCDLLLQNCSPGKACYFFDSGNSCGLARDGVRDEPCSTNTECAPGLECSPNGTGERYACEPYCSLDEQAPNACTALCAAWLLTDEDGIDLAGVCRAP